MAQPLDNLRAAYHELERRVITALRTQLGDAGRLGEIRGQVLQLLGAAEQVFRTFLSRYCAVILIVL
jgi:hypothetical protein